MDDSSPLNLGFGVWSCLEALCIAHTQLRSWSLGWRYPNGRIVLSDEPTEDMPGGGEIHETPCQAGHLKREAILGENSSATVKISTLSKKGITPSNTS